MNNQIIQQIKKLFKADKKIYISVQLEKKFDFDYKKFYISVLYKKKPFLKVL
jgi:hypothetical protein